MESTVVIKVKHGETLRRFNALVNEDGRLDLDIGGLREKVIGLFSFAPDADLTLTYIDEDGDVVTLVDEEDLFDVMRQSLNPVRITVKLNAEKGGRFYARSSGSSTPMRSPIIQYPVPELNSSVSEYVKSVPDPLRETLSKMAIDLASKAASSSPVLAELVDCFSKMGLPHIKPVSNFQVGAESSTSSGASGSALDASLTKGTKASREDGAMAGVFPDAKVEDPASNTTQKVDRVNSTRGLGSLNLDADLPGDYSQPGSVSANLAPSKEEVKKLRQEEVKKLRLFKKKEVAKKLSEMAGKSAWVNPKTVTSSAPASDNTNVKTSGFILANDSAVGCAPYYPHVHPFKRSFTCSDGMGSVIHGGVQCDGCDVYPITGPRFKSKVKGDYDLCSTCFSKMGNEADYIRMDRPASYQFPNSFKGFYDPMQQSIVRPPTLPHVWTGGRMRPSGLKLDSRFIMDVNVMDGTLMAPSTPFTKIWRLRNNGTIVWPQGTQLVRIGGNEISAAHSELQIPVDGLPVDNELDVAVDFTAPEQPGRYISYWRLASPSGEKFGQRFWVLIQVDVSLSDDSLTNSFQDLNLNLPPQDTGVARPESVNVKVEPMIVEEGSLPEPDNSDRAFELVVPLVDASPSKNQDLNFPTNDTLLVGGGVSNTVPHEAPTSVSFPSAQIASPVSLVSSPHASSSSTAVPELAQGTGDDTDVEESLLKELEEMGFKQVDLNKEVLRLNEYNLEQSLDDLCGVAEWDPILEELQEMGFCDKEMNKMLLKKNGGSIKRVVMDLITGEKAP